MKIKKGAIAIEENKKSDSSSLSSKLDFSLETPQERNELVKKIIDETPPELFTNKDLEIFSDYIIFAMDKQEKKQKRILTENRMVTINKWERSFQGLCEILEGGEDSLYNMIIDDKNVILSPKISITQKDLKEIPELRELREAIEKIEQQEKTATGHRRYLLKKQLIEMRKDQYVIKNAFRKPMYFTNIIKCISKINFDEDIKITKDGEVTSNGLISIFDYKHVSALLCNYSKLKEDSWGKFWTDSYYLMEDLDNLIERTLKEDYPLYYDLLIYKIDGKQNAEIQKLIEEKYGIKHSEGHLSSLWRNKIPKLISQQAQEDYILWYYTEKEKGKWKRCSRCGCVKLADNRFFSKNKTSRDGLYSICKKCRNSKNKK